MEYQIDEQTYDIWAEPTEGGYLGCFRCPCGYSHCSNHVESEKMAIITGRSQAYTHYRREHSPK